MISEFEKFKKEEIDNYLKILGRNEVPTDYYDLLGVAKFSNDMQQIKDDHRRLNGRVREGATGELFIKSQEILF